MPHVTIRSPDIGGVTLLTPTGGTVYLPQRRLLAWVYLGSEAQMRPAIVDTGAPACILPQRIWTALDDRGEIAWLTDTSAQLAKGKNAGEPAHTIVAGGRHQYRLGRVRPSLTDLGDGRLAPCDEVLALCTDDPIVPPEEDSLPLIIGLAEVLNGRSLLLQVSESGERWSALMNEP
jgi:hypothetical protein